MLTKNMVVIAVQNDKINSFLRACSFAHFVCKGNSTQFPDIWLHTKPNIQIFFLIQLQQGFLSLMHLTVTLGKKTANCVTLCLILEGLDHLLLGKLLLAGLTKL